MKGFTGNSGKFRLSIPSKEGSANSGLKFIPLSYLRDGYPPVEWAKMENFL